MRLEDIMAKAIWKFRWDCGRLGCAEGVFVAEETEVRAAIGKEIYVEEAFGKHSSLRGRLNETHVRKVTDNSDTVSTFEELKLQTGINPLHYLNGG